MTGASSGARPGLSARSPGRGRAAPRRPARGERAVDVVAVGVADHDRLAGGGADAGSAAAKISGAGLNRPTWALVTAPSTSSRKVERLEHLVEVAAGVRDEADGQAGGAQTHKAGPHVVVEREVLAAAPGLDDGRRAAADPRRVVAPHGGHDGLGDDLVDLVVVGVAAPGAARLDGRAARRSASCQRPGSRRRPKRAPVAR